MSTADTRSRWPRRALIGIAALATLLGAAYVGLSLAFPPERLAALLARQLGDATGREAHIGGKLSYQLLPNLAVVARGVTLANAPGGSRPQMLTVDRLALDLALWPLLQGRFEVGTVAIDGVDLLLETDRDGRGNWQLTPRPADAAKAPDAKPEASTKADVIRLAQLKLSDVRMQYRNARSAAEPLVFDVQRLHIEREADAAALAGTFTLNAQRWQVAGRTGQLAALFSPQGAWPFDVQISTDGARATAKGQWQLDKRSGSAELTLKVDRAAAVAPWLGDGARVPLPIELGSRVALDADSLRAEALTLSWAGQQFSGQATVKLGSRPLGIDARLAAPMIDVAALWPGAQAAAAAPAGKRSELFDDTPVALPVLPDVDAHIALEVRQLRWPRVPELSALSARVAIKGGRLGIEPLNFKIADGSVGASLVLMPQADRSAQWQLRLNATQLSVDALAQAMGNGAYAQGGRLQLQTNLRLRGPTPRALAASADGEVLLQLADVTLSGKLSPDGPNLLVRLLQTITGQANAVQQTHVQCAVVRLPLKAGVATIDRSIAVETDQLDISASGEVNLRDQRLALAFKPHVKKALSLNTAGLASLVVLKGPLLDPKFGLDAAGTASLALNLGLAGATGGLSLLGERLFRQASDPQPCRRALSGEASADAAGKAPAARQPAETQPASPAKQLPELLRRLFK